MLLAPPESHFGNEVAQEIALYLENFRNTSMAFLPEDKSLWMILIENASATYTLDSGFMHMALGVSEAEDVVGIILDSHEYWLKPGQPRIYLNELL